jgi:hypothetical protein
MVSGWKKVRHDPISKTLPSKFFNWTTARVSKIPLHDFNCGLKAYRNKVVKSIEVYGEMHRYIPVIAKWSGFRKIGEKVVQHRARKYGYTKFGGLGRGLKGLLDLASITFVGKYGKRPMHFFGPLGVIVTLVGFGETISLLISKLISKLDHTSAAFALTNKPSFYIALTCMVLGTQLFLTGFMAELISRNSPGRNSYLIEQKIGLDIHPPAPAKQRRPPKDPSSSSGRHILCAVVWPLSTNASPGNLSQRAMTAGSSPFRCNTLISCSPALPNILPIRRRKD